MNPKPSPQKHNAASHGHYTHGLEAIYTFETIDPQSVRPLHTESSTFPQEEPDICHHIHGPSTHSTSSCHSYQHTLPFSPRTPLPNLRLIEPVEALGLSAFILSRIRQLQIRTIEDLLVYTEDHLQQSPSETKPSSFRRERLSPSQVEEFHAQSRAYTLAGQRTIPFVEWDKLAFLSFITLPSSQEEETALQLFSLHSCLEYAKKLFGTSKDRLSAHEKALTEKALIEYIQNIFTRFVAPWISSQGNIIHISELIEYLFDISSPTLQKEIPLEFASWLKFIAWRFNEPYLYASKLSPLSHIYREILAWGQPAYTDGQSFLLSFEEVTGILGKSSHPLSVRGISRALEQSLVRKWLHVDKNLLTRLVFWALHTKAQSNQ